jgi:hypothetical protein
MVAVSIQTPKNVGCGLNSFNTTFWALFFQRH